MTMRARVLAAAVLAGIGAAVLVAAAPPTLYPDRTIDTGLGKLTDLALSSDGRFVGATGAAGYGVWDAQAAKAITQGPAAATGSYTRLALSPQATMLAVGASDGKVAVIDLRGNDRKDVAKHQKAIRSMAFSPDGRMGVSGDAEGTMMLWPVDGSAPASALKDGNSKAALIYLGFTDNALIALDADLNVVTWDINGKRAVRRNSLQTRVSGRSIEPMSASLDPTGSRLLVAAQLMAQPRAGVLSGANDRAAPSDLKRDNVVMGYSIATGLSADPVNTSDFKGEWIAATPGGCYAVFSSYYRNQARLHVWGLVDKGDDLLRQDVASRPMALVLDAGGRLLAAAGENGQITTWRASGLTTADCAIYNQAAQKPAAAPQPIISTGPDKDPLIKSGTGVRLAVMKFESRGLSADLGASVAEMISEQLANSQGVIVAERSSIDALLKEIELQRSGLTTSDPVAAAVQIGKGVNARKVIMGSVSRFGEDAYVLSARVVDVETQRVEGSRSVTCNQCKEQNLIDAVAALKPLLVK